MIFTYHEATEFTKLCLVQHFTVPMLCIDLLGVVDLSLCIDIFGLPNFFNLLYIDKLEVADLSLSIDKFWLP